MRASRVFARFGLLCGLLWGSLFSPRLVRADNAQEARALFDAGVAASGGERWRDARDYLKRSAELFPKAATLLNLAVAEVKLELREEALQTLDTFDHIADPNVHTDLIERARVLRSLAEQLPSKESRHPPADEHEETRLAPVADEAPEPAAAPPEDRAQTDTERAEPSYLGAYTLWATGGLLASASFVGAGFWLNRNAEIDKCQSRTPACDNKDKLDRQHDTAVQVTLIGAGLSLVTLAAGTIWFVRLKTRGITPEASASKNAWKLGFSARF